MDCGGQLLVKWMAYLVKTSKMAENKEKNDGNTVKADITQTGCGGQSPNGVSASTAMWSTPQYQKFCR